MGSQTVYTGTSSFSFCMGAEEDPKSKRNIPISYSCGGAQGEGTSPQAAREGKFLVQRPHTLYLHPGILAVSPPREHPCSGAMSVADSGAHSTAVIIPVIPNPARMHQPSVISLPVSMHWCSASACRLVQQLFKGGETGPYVMILFQRETSEGKEVSWEDDKMTKTCRWLSPHWFTKKKQTRKVIDKRTQASLSHIFGGGLSIFYPNMPIITVWVWTDHRELSCWKGPCPMEDTPSQSQARQQSRPQTYPACQQSVIACYTPWQKQHFVQ